MSYTPGVARVCEAIVADPEAAHEYTWVSNTVAVVTDGTACWAWATSALPPRCR